MFFLCSTTPVLPQQTPGEDGNHLQQAEAPQWGPPRLQAEAPWGSPIGHGPDIGRRPISRTEVQKGRTLIPAPRPPQTPEGHASSTRTQSGNPTHPDREQGPIPGGWAGPTNPLGDEIPAGRLNIYIYIYIYIYTY